MNTIRGAIRLNRWAAVYVLALLAILSLAACSSKSPNSGLAAFGDQLNKVYEESLPSVVEVVVWGSSKPGTGSFSRSAVGIGTGFVWDEEGHIVTNEHVVELRNDHEERIAAERISVIFSDGSDYDAQMVGSDYISDLAVLKVDVPAEKFKPLLLGDSGSVKVGQLALAIGHPFGYDFSMTRGIVSSIDRIIYHEESDLPIPGSVIQIDTAINHGNSGGPVLDIDGRAIGIAVQIFSQFGENAGVGFAIPVNTVRSIVPDLIEKGGYDYPWVGIMYTSISASWIAKDLGFPEDTRGAVIRNVVKGSPAEKAGFLVGDIITAADGVVVKKSAGLVQMVVLHRPGDKMTFEVTRDGEQLVLEVTLGKYEADVFKP